MDIFLDSIPEVKLKSDKRFYKLEYFFPFSKPILYHEMPENLLLFYPRYLETHFGLSFAEIMDWHRNDYNLNFGGLTRLITKNITLGHATEYINNNETVKYWITRDFFVRLTDCYQWTIVQLLTGDLLLLIRLDASQVVDIIMFTRQALIYPLFL